MKTNQEITLKEIWPIPLRRDGLLPKSAIWGTNCSFQQGQNHLVLAPSGRGKSTLVHLLYGLRHDYEGTLLIDGEEARQKTAEQWLSWRREKLAIVFQDLRLFPQLTAWENIQVKAQLQSPLSEEVIRQMCQNLDIESLLQQPAAELSFGQQQRVAIVRALCQPFSYLLLDEPFSHLDEENIAKASQVIKEVCDRQQAGVIMVSLGATFDFEYAQRVEL